MARYYNKTRGPLSFALRDGTPVLVRPKSWTMEIPPEQDGSSSLAQLKRKGFLIRGKDKPAPAPAPAKPAPKAKAKAPKVAAPKAESTTSKKAGVAPKPVDGVEKLGEVVEDDKSASNEKTKSKASKGEGSKKTSSRSRRK